MKISCDCLVEFFNQRRSYLYNSGEVILRPEDIPSGVYFIEKGFVKIYSITQDGNEKLHIIYKAGEIFPWIWIFRNIAKAVFYEALGEVVLKRRSKEDFLEFLKICCSSQQNCHCATKQNCSILFMVVDNIIDILDIHVDRINNLELTRAYPRMIARLIYLAKRFGEKRGKSIVLNVPITHTDIANSINMTRETASRELEKLVQKRLVKYTGHLLTIINLTKLEKELEIHYEREQL